MNLQVDLQTQLPGFNLEVAFETQAATLGLLGASGSGKSLTLRCIAGLETPSQGRIVLNQRVLFDSSQGINLPSRQRRIGFLFQNYALFPHQSVAQNVAFGLQGLPKVERAQRLETQLARVQLQGLEDRYPHQLSGGQQQRVALARALATEPELLLLDEPFSALDTHLRSQMEKLLLDVLSAYAGVSLFVTHNLEEAYRICPNLLVLAEGQVVANGPKQEIFQRPPSFAVAQLTGCKNFSRAHVVAPQQVEALDWNCRLRVPDPVPRALAYVGIRAHHLAFLESADSENSFACWLAQTSETPFRMTLYLKLHSPPTHPNDYHLQAEVFKEQWAVLNRRSCPWSICLEPLRLLLLEG